MAALQRMAVRAGAPDRELEPDNAFTCRLTMEVASPARPCCQPNQALHIHGAQLALEPQQCLTQRCCLAVTQAVHCRCSGSLSSRRQACPTSRARSKSTSARRAFLPWIHCRFMSSSISPYLCFPCLMCVAADHLGLLPFSIPTKHPSVSKVREHCKPASVAVCNALQCA